MRALLLAAYVAVGFACDGGKPPVPQRWRLVGSDAAQELASEAECKALLAKAMEDAKHGQSEQRELRLKEETLRRQEALALARAEEDHACAEAKLRCDISTPAKRAACDAERSRLEGICARARETREAREKQVAAPVPDEPSPPPVKLACEPVASGR